jgi:hypothetical protein
MNRKRPFLSNSYWHKLQKVTKIGHSLFFMKGSTLIERRSTFLFLVLPLVIKVVAAVTGGSGEKKSLDTKRPGPGWSKKCHYLGV